jgi:hypothetical protein
MEFSMDASASVVAFRSDAKDLMSTPDTNGAADLFVFDRMGKVLRLVSRRPEWPPSVGSAASIGPVVSLDGLYVGFSSEAADLVPDDFNVLEDAFLLGPTRVPVPLQRVVVD